ncbi:ABC transporter ATP-binding protein [Larsenimonas salina]|uniref:ABC transporter ATP-binding protein n=1 Tax=Larsenimonas salina TaxID=1295565 RepID=UPI002072AD48|nr:ABC transporter ATP-binding protein [Larsenimonas salina]
MTSTPLGLTVEEASLAYQGTPLFRDLSLKLAPSSWCCLLGRSGCGKSSLLRLVAGLNGSKDTQVRLSDHAGHALPAQAFAWMAQQDALFPWLSVVENLLLGDRLQGRPKNSARRAEAIALLETLNLADKAEARPYTLSGGQRQRVALARTLMRPSPIVLMDEPFSAVDAITRYDLHELATSLLSDRTVLMVTHDPGEALHLSDRILVLSPSGRLAPFDCGGPPKALSLSQRADAEKELITLLGHQ